MLGTEAWFRFGQPQKWERAHVGFGGTGRKRQGSCMKQWAWRKHCLCDTRLAEVCPPKLSNTVTYRVEEMRPKVGILEAPCAQMRLVEAQCAHRKHCYPEPQLGSHPTSLESVLTTSMSKHMGFTKFSVLLKRVSLLNPWVRMNFVVFQIGKEQQERASKFGSILGRDRGLWAASIRHSCTEIISCVVLRLAEIWPKKITSRDGCVLLSLVNNCSAAAGRALNWTQSYSRVSQQMSFRMWLTVGEAWFRCPSACGWQWNIQPLCL